MPGLAAARRARARGAWMLEWRMRSMSRSARAGAPVGGGRDTDLDSGSEGGRLGPTGDRRGECAGSAGRGHRRGRTEAS
jgi:hypothetical protein